MAWPQTMQKITSTVLTTAGTTYGTAYFQPGRSVVQVIFTNPTTVSIDWMAEVSDSTCAHWWDAFAAASTVTTGATVRVSSTYTGMIFDRVRISTTDGSTATGAFTWWVDAR